MNKDSRILVTGCQGMAGWAVIKELQKQGFTNVLGIDRSDLDLLYTDDVDRWFSKHKPEYVFHIAAKVGGIYANDTQSADFLYENLMMQCNVINAAWNNEVTKLLFCGSACIYPKNTQQPIKEDYLLTGILEETNKAYAIAKIAGVTMCQMYRKQYGCNFISVMPTNLYGPGDNFSSMDSHVIPALIRKVHNSKINNLPNVEIWGTGEPLREFLYIDDLAKGLIFCMENYDESEPINIGTGIDVPIKYVVKLISEIFSYSGEIIFNTEYKDGVKRRVLDTTKINGLGWYNSYTLRQGLEITCKWFVDNYDTCRK